MNDYNNAFLGFILAGVLMLVVGLSLLVRPGVIPGRDQMTTAAEAATGSAMPATANSVATTEQDGRRLIRGTISTSER